MKKVLFVLYFILAAAFSYAVSTLENLPSNAEGFSQIKMLNDTQGHTFVFWLEKLKNTSGLVGAPIKYNIKFSSKPIKGEFTDPTTIGAALSYFYIGNYGPSYTDPIYDAAIDVNGNIMVMWGGKGDGIYFAYKAAGASSFSAPVKAFTLEEQDELKLKAAPNGTFFAVISTDNGYFYSQRLSGAATTFSSPKKLSSAYATGIVNFDFDFDPDSNVLFVYLDQNTASTAQSDIFYAFKPVNADFQAHKKVDRLSGTNFTADVHVIYNEQIGGYGRTWGLFWLETPFQNPAFDTEYLRGIMLKNNGDNTNVSAAASAKIVYQTSVKTQIGDKSFYNVLENLGFNKIFPNKTFFSSTSSYPIVNTDSGIVIDIGSNGYYSIYELSKLLENSGYQLDLTAINIKNGFMDSASVNGDSNLAVLSFLPVLPRKLNWGIVTLGNGAYQYLGEIPTIAPGATRYSLEGVVGFITMDNPTISWIGGNSSEKFDTVVQSLYGSKIAPNVLQAWKNRANFQKGVSPKSSNF